MDLYVFIIFAFIVLSVIGSEIYSNIKSKKNENVFIKDNDFLLMRNAGADPCEENQKIILMHYYARPISWIIEVEK